MRITLNGLDKEMAISIRDWMEDPRARLFLEQMRRTEEERFESLLNSDSMTRDSEMRGSIKTMRGILAYHSHLTDFIKSEGSEEKSLE